jgi:hypothetical protein
VTPDRLGLETAESFHLQILPHDFARRDASLQRVQSMIQAHLSAGHEEVFGHDVLRAKQFCRLTYVVGEKRLVREVETFVPVAFRWINIPIKLLGKP